MSPSVAVISNSQLMWCSGVAVLFAVGGALVAPGCAKVVDTNCSGGAVSVSRA